MKVRVCKFCFGSGVRYFPIGGNLLQAYVCNKCKGKREK